MTVIQIPRISEVSTVEATCVGVGEGGLAASETIVVEVDGGEQHVIDQEWSETQTCRVSNCVA